MLTKDTYIETSKTELIVYVQIIIPLALPINYTYSVPKAFDQSIKVGQRVEVQLRNKKYAGIIKSISTAKPEKFDPKDIINILDEEPLVYEKQLQLWQWIAQYYMCSEGDVMQAAVPANLKLNSETILIWNDETEVDLNDGSLFSDNEYVVAQALEIKKELKMSEVQQLLDSNNVTPIIKKLIEKNLFEI